MAAFRGQTTSKANSRPGDEPYTPTRLEWAAVELQADYGNPNWASESPVTITYFATDDGTTVLCLLQYTADTIAPLVKLNRDTAQSVFDKYAQSRGWTWLRLKFEERVIPHPH